jgi:uncharacterized membrane protein (DUF485 family)
MGFRIKNMGYNDPKGTIMPIIVTIIQLIATAVTLIILTTVYMTMAEEKKKDFNEEIKKNIWRRSSK